MNQRIVIKEVEPKAYEAMFAFEKYLSRTKLTAIEKHLIKIRASQINGCAYCINMHTKEARELGETEQRIYALSAWRDTPYFTEKERAILALTEEVTLIHQKVSEKTYQQAARLLDEVSLAQVIMSIIGINAWNRIAISTHLMPPLE
ncbi:carboxymuconolactone decarboxylase family protein [Rhodocytophaga aerolata]|uniref:Carboxymuconolactone decarboxylase family protein n=1 Tax=Rhodocytophaga aerolata TaxID=455078 RepID=A0ABT8RDV1_9BACT|nr:carboxymuconolactone decarboxylase family protein [Rhodocytophaga aerolata]MDO1450139.1 carboxymuconolactone decarboxylase family protein [Rhodocytophaga aerolata]